MLHRMNGFNTLLQSNFGSEHSCVIIDALSQIMVIAERDEHLEFPNRLVTVGCLSSQIIGMYLDRASGKLDYTVLEKFLAPFFARLPVRNAILSSNRKEELAIEDSALQLDSISEYHRSTK